MVNFLTSLKPIFCLLAWFNCVAWSQTPSQISTYQGNWRFVFNGGISGDGKMTIGADNTIAISVSVGHYQHLFSNPIVLSVGNDGTLRGSIRLLKIPVGNVIGIFSQNGDLYGEVSTPFLDVGTVIGKLKREEGRGTYRSVAGAGTWSARKE